MNALAIVQARMTSTRLPGKVLADVQGEPMIALLLRRLAAARRLGGIVVATSSDASDDRIADVVGGLGFPVHRGDLHDVLARYVGAARGHAGPFVRITADCPLVDPGVIDALLERFARAPDAVYASNVDERSYPDGLDAEVFTADALRRADELAREPADREHVTTVMRRERDLFPAVSLVAPRDLAHLRWTVDTPEDLAFVRAVAERLGDRRHVAAMDEILEAIRRPPALRDPGGARA